MPKDRALDAAVRLFWASGYDAASIDGGSRWQQFRHITFFGGVLGALIGLVQALLARSFSF